MTRTEHAAVTRDRILRARLWLIPCALIWIPMGIGTMNGLAGNHATRRTCSSRGIFAAGR